jgi:hypothetical protein
MTDWNKLKVVDLKTELKKRGLAQTGLKPALVARLAEAENADGSESENTIQDDANKLDTNSATSPDTISPIVPTSDVNADIPAETAPQATTEHSEPPTAPGSTLQDPSAIDFQAEPLPTQPTHTVESSQASAQNDQHKSALPSVEPQEAIDDRQKRKRRSQSPPPSTADSARKRFRNDTDGEQMDGVVTSQEDANWVEKHNVVDKGAVNAAPKEVASDGIERGPTIVDAKEEVKIEDVQMSGVGEVKSEEKMEIDEAPKRESATLDGDSPSKTRDSRQFKNLFTGEPQGTAMAISRSHDSSEEAEPDRVIAPAIHPATSALYIRDIMRPLNLANLAQLKLHLATLAAPPGQEPDLDVVVNFYIDTIRTHAFVSFINTSAASRVRSALHDRIWPDEKTRKPLWVDFIPVEKLDEWIDREMAEPGGRSAAKKWEVYYDVDEDRRVTAMLQEASSLRSAQHVRRPSASVPPIPSPQAPRRIENAPSAPRSFNIRGQGAPMAKLDELFKSTTAKPMLYYQPVPKALVNRRLDNIDAAMSKDAAAGRRMTGPINRYTFEDGDKLVDRGPEIFPGIRPPSDQRRGGGGRGGPSRDGYRGRGGGGYGDRPPQRVYESFRPGMDSRDDRDRRY